MNGKLIEKLEPELLWKNFHLLTRTPRPSHHEEAVQQLLMGFASRLGLEVERDEPGNVIVRKPATPGMEDRKGVILQGHLDMVPQANTGSSHDFTKDPIQTRIEGDWVHAEGTTLGADNGIGVAAAMAVLESTDLLHGPIEALFTSNEEDGMGGAFGLASGLLQGDILVNMDSEDEGVLCIGCAGGANVNSELPYRAEHTEEGMTAFSLSVTGLKGGHSGVDIHRGRGNANKLLFRFIGQVQNACGLRLAGVDGGSLRNAIPREAFATVLVPTENESRLKQLLQEWQAVYSDELSQTDAGVLLSLQPEAVPRQYMDTISQQKLLDLVGACPHGVIRMSDSMPGLVETSTNLAIVKTEDGFIRVFNLVRSSVNSARDMVCESIQSLFSLAGAETTFDGHYPGWQPNPDSPVLKTTLEAYRECFGSEAEIGGIHAGLECGILGATYPRWDMISFGPTIRYPHSPDERVQISSVARFWELLARVLESTPEKG
ncbi:MAG: aminoacyl-histidine dipeptidase [Candidatus Sedimenticola sp. 20ELBAFRAG]